MADSTLRNPLRDPEVMDRDSGEMVDHAEAPASGPEAGGAEESGLTQLPSELFKPDDYANPMRCACKAFCYALACPFVAAYMCLERFFFYMFACLSYVFRECCVPCMDASLACFQCIYDHCVRPICDCVGACLAALFEATSACVAALYEKGNRVNRVFLCGFFAACARAPCDENNDNSDDDAPAGLVCCCYFIIFVFASIAVSHPPRRPRLLLV